MKRAASRRLSLPCTGPDADASSELDRVVADLNAIDPDAAAPLWRQRRTLDVVRSVAARLDANGCNGHAEGYARCLLHEDPSGWSLAAIVLRPGQSTPAHDHGGWGGAVTVQGVERDRRFRHGANGKHAVLGERDYPPGAGYLFDSVDIHQPLGADPDVVTVALHFLARSDREWDQHHHEAKAASTAHAHESGGRRES